MEDYKQALERCIKEFDYNNLAYSHDEVKQKLERIFPELKEYKDELVRKGIIRCIEGNMPDNNFRKEYITWLEKQGEQKPIKYIQWTGKNLKEVINFTGKSEKFDEWFKSWDDYEAYVHSHGDIFKLFCVDGSHYEVPIGAWIIKTPEGYNIPSKFRLVLEFKDWSNKDQEIWTTITDLLWEGYKLSDKKVSWDTIRHWLLPKIKRVMSK